MSTLIHAIRCNQSSFKEVEFSSGFNVILAERTKESTKKDSRNGLGKSTLIEIIHFCLGASTNRKLSTHLKDWDFTLNLEINGDLLDVRRSFESPSICFLSGDFSEISVKSKRNDYGEFEVLTKDLNSYLGNRIFNLPIKEERKYKPTFRSLISYFIRRGRDSFSKPFEHHRKQLEWEKQVCNAFLLNLAWEDASDWQVLKDKKKLLNDLKSASEAGVVSEMFGSLGELQAAKVRLENQILVRQKNLINYRVHPQYREIQERVDTLTEEIHSLINKNISDERLLSYYLSSIEDEQEPPAVDIVALYAKVSIELPELVQRRLNESELFHSQVIGNRKDFLLTETARLKRNLKLNEGVTDRKSKVISRNKFTY